MYLLYLTSVYLTLPYILQTYSSQNTQTYFSCIFKLHVSQKYTYTRSMSNKVSPYNSYTYYKHHISQYIYIYIYFSQSPHILKHIKYYSKNLLLKTLSYERHIFIILKALLMKGKNL